MSRRRAAVDPHPALAEAVSVTRFWSLVERSTAMTCWLWSGDTDRDGYGVFFYRGRLRPAHELALSFTTGEQRIDSLDTCHSCDTPPCCNPEHLRFDTRASNVADMVSRGRASTNNARLTPADVELIRQRRSMGARQKDLAVQFGVSAPQISEIVRGLAWPHAGGPIQTERKYVRG